MRQNPERLAWHILLASFTVFLALCAGVAYFTQWYLFRSMVGIDVTLRAARGTVIIAAPVTQEEIAVSEQRSGLTPGMTVRTDANAQGLLTFNDAKSGDPLASVVILRNSEVVIVRASAPRFGINRSPYYIAIETPSGRSEILIFEHGARGTAFSARSPHVLTEISATGHYALDVTDQQTRVTTGQGLARVTELASGRQVYLTDGRQTIVDREVTASLPVLETEVSLIRNNSFALSYEDGWEFINDGDPAGAVFHATFEGRPVLVIDRAAGNWPGERLDHGESRLTQEINRDVTPYDYLELRATFYVDEQSLSTCGVQGSECAMMIRLEYTDVMGTQREFIHGFYGFFDPVANYPLACATCRTEHEGINLRTWFTYKSGNLFNVLPAEQRPAFIQRLSFYASGHAYKVYVSEVDLLAARQ